MKNKPVKHKPNFIDVFAGCGGLSLGLIESGWKGIFAIEKDELAFSTLKYNLIDRIDGYCWPAWLNEEPYCIEELIKNKYNELMQLSGKVDMIAGGPPCQGFSSAGRRVASDPRNQLIKSYFKLVSIINPKIVLIENVKGITQDFSTPDGVINYSDLVGLELGEKYNVYSRLINVSDFGVPQNRIRYFVIAVRKDCLESKVDPVHELFLFKDEYVKSKGLNVLNSSQDAISDLEISRCGVKDYEFDRAYSSVDYAGPLTKYQRLMNRKAGYDITNTRLAKHKPLTVEKFKYFIKTCIEQGRLNVSLSKEVKSKYGLKKSAIRVLDPNSLAPTVTSMPDDLIHYKEPRTLTVRENARLQSFPDCFVFCGKYTSGGNRRSKEVPRFTQVANAVPPLVSEAIGIILYKQLLK